MEEYFILEALGKNNKKLFYSPRKDYCELIDDENHETNIDAHYQVLLSRKDISIKPRNTLTPNLYLTLTNDCNLNCKYCYADGGEEYKKGNTTKDILKNSIDAYYEKIVEKKISSCTIGFQGGCEPTCAFELMKYAVCYSNKLAKESGITSNYRMATNGFYSEEISDFVCDNFSQISLSFDGTFDIQNFQRPSRNGGESFKRVFKNATKLKNSKVNWSIHSVVTEYSLDELEKSMEFFTTNFPDTKVVFALMDKANDKVEIDPPNAIIYHSEIKRLSDIYPNLELSCIVNFKFLKKDYCDSVTNLDWYVSELGVINTCMRSSHSDNSIFAIGKFDDTKNKFVFDKPKIKNLKKFSIDNQEDCKSCFAKYICGGGCPYLRDSGNWDCNVTRLSVKDEIYRNYEETDLRHYLEQLKF